MIVPGPSLRLIHRWSPLILKVTLDQFFGALQNFNQLDFKVESSSTRDDVTSTLVSIAKSRRDDQLPLLTDAHAQDSLVPALDHLTNSDLELERLASVVTRVELGSRLEGANVVNGEHVSVPGHLVAGVWLR